MIIKDFDCKRCEQYIEDQDRCRSNIESIRMDICPEYKIVEKKNGNDQCRTMKVKLDEGAFLPEKAHPQDAGYDLRTPIRAVLHPNSSVTIRTGVHIQLPAGKCGVVISKSGLYTKHNISSTGLVDEGYTGEIVIHLQNHGGAMYIFEAGDKISQLLITDYYTYQIEQVAELDQSERGGDGFGSTGR